MVRRDAQKPEPLLLIVGISMFAQLREGGRAAYFPC